MTTENKPDSITKVHFSKGGVYKYMSGKRLPIAVRIDSGLYSRFKPLSKQVYGSTCKAVEVYMISLIEAVENGVHFSNTGQPINIDKIVIERGLRERRKLEVAEDGGLCGVANCYDPAVGRALWLPKNKEFAVCQVHLREAVANPRVWRVIEKKGS